MNETAKHKKMKFDIRIFFIIYFGTLILSLQLYSAWLPFVEEYPYTKYLPETCWKELTGTIYSRNVEGEIDTITSGHGFTVCANGEGLYLRPTALIYNIFYVLSINQSALISWDDIAIKANMDSPKGYIFRFDKLLNSWIELNFHYRDDSSRNICEELSQIAGNYWLNAAKDGCNNG